MQPLLSEHRPALLSRWTPLLFIICSVAGWVLLFGFQPAFLSFGTLGSTWLIVFILAVIAVAWMPPTAGRMDRLLKRINEATARRRLLCSLFAAVGATVYLYLTARAEGRQFFPYYHDEFSYLIQAQQLARGHLWMPPHPLPRFFDSFQLLVEPVYASAYFPGTAMLYVPGIWLHAPPYVTSLIIAGAVAGMVFLVVARLVNGLWAWLAWLLLLSNALFRELSIMTLAQLPLLLYVLIALSAWLRWRVIAKRRWALLIGLSLGLAAVCRPVDALCFAIPVALAVLLHRKRAAILIITLGALPLLCLQLALDRGITGHWLQTPFTFYADRDYPGTAYGFQPFNPDARAVSQLEQKQMLFEQWKPLEQAHSPSRTFKELLGWRLRLVLGQQSPSLYPLLMVLSPLALLGLNRPRAVLLASFPLFLLLYTPYVFFLPHYVMTAAPAMLLAVLIGATVLQNRASLMSPGMGRLAAVALPLFITGLAIAALPQCTGASDEAFKADLLASVNEQLAHLPHRPAVVLFTFDRDRNLNEEPVYNADVPWPDDAPVIRAHDLGPLDQQIFRYYALRQPNRFFYRFDEKTRTLHPLGYARDLAR